MRVGLVGGWIDVERTWSGIPRGLAGGLEELGVYAGYRDCTPSLPGMAWIGRWLRLTRRFDGGWALRPEMLAAIHASAALSRRRPWPADTGWVHLTGIIGRPERGRFVTLEDMTVAQIESHRRHFQGTGFAKTVNETSARGFARWRTLQRDLYAHAHACCVTSNWVRDSLVADFGVPASRIHVVGWGRNVDVDAPQRRDWSVPRFLWVGGEWRRKNGDAVVRAFERLRVEHPGARLDLVGGHPPLDVEGVTGHGVLSFRDPEQAGTLRALFEAATCFVMPSWVEPFAIAYLEAAHAGMPVIASAVGGARDLFDGDAGVVVDPADGDALLAAMRSLSDPVSAARMGAVAVERSRAFTWANLARRITGILESPR